jgi:RNA polymerase sigma-70 factor (ECF subfamily)
VEDRPPTEAELVAGARRGDEVAVRGLVNLHAEIAFRTAYLVLRDAAEAEDATQEAFVKALAALDRFRDGEPLRPWLLRIVANTARNRRRSQGRRVALGERVGREPRPTVTPSAEATVLADERRRAVLAAVDQLPDDDRLVIAGRYFLDLSETEIAALAGVRRGTVKSRLFRARGRLTTLLGDLDPRTDDD